jgi:hypothetical protein
MRDGSFSRALWLGRRGPGNGERLGERTVFAREAVETGKKRLHFRDDVCGD